jgi:hypothetical protein
VFTAGNSSAILAYNTWLGIQLFWRPGGTWESGILPDPNSENVMERYALQLKQKHIQNMKSAIKEYLKI